MRRRPAGPVEIPPGQSVSPEPSGLHIMFTGLEYGLKTGEIVPGRLLVEHAGIAEIASAVGGIADRGPAGAAPAHEGHAMPGMDME